MNEFSYFDPHKSTGSGFSAETAKITAAMSETVGDLDALDALVEALKASGIWGRLGEISWARDTHNGLLIEWIPASER